MEHRSSVNENSISPKVYANYEDEISLFDILALIWKRKYFIFFSVLIFIAMAGIYLLVTNGTSYKTSAVLSLNFPGIETHHNPNGSTFDKYQIINPSILSKVDFFDKNTVFPEDKTKRSMLFIDDIISQDILDKIKKDPAITYLTNMFSLSIITDKKAFISEIERSRILVSIIEEYQKEFLNKYMKEIYFAENFPENFFIINDYPEILNILKVRIDNVITSLDEKVKISGNYRSTTENLSFSDLKANFEILKTIELARIKDVVEGLILTKDKNILIIKLKQQIKNIEYEMDKENGKALIAQELFEQLNPYLATSTSTQSIPTGVSFESTFIEKLRKEDNVSYLIKTILQAKENANNYLIEKNKKNKTIQELEKEISVTEKILHEQTVFVESSLKRIIDKYKALISKVNGLNQAFFNVKYANAIKIEQTPISSIIKEKKSFLILSLTGMVSLFISIFAVFFIEYIKNATLEQGAVKKHSDELISSNNISGNLNKKIGTLKEIPEEDIKKSRNAC